MSEKRLEDYTWEELLEATSHKESQKENGKDIGKWAYENNMGIHTEDEELRKEWAKMGGSTSGPMFYENGLGIFSRDEDTIKKDASKGGKVSAKKYNGKWLKEYVKNNPEICSKGGKISGKKNVESGHLAKLREQYLESNMQYLDHEEHICPHCGKVATGGVYYRWHGDNCKELQKIEEQLNIIKDLPETFTSNDVVRICKEKGYNNKKIKYGVCKNPKYIELIHKGTNQTNPSIFRKI